MDPPSSSLSSSSSSSTSTSSTSPSSSSSSSSSSSVMSSIIITTEEAPASEVEHKHVTEVYDLIALHFSSTRYKAWPRVENFLNSLPQGAVVADVGCGNGKYLGVNKNVFAIGSDRTGKFAEICAEKGFESMICDNLQLPYRTNSFDSVISIAVVHHFASPDRRLQAIQELVRILKSGGRLLFTVWAVQQDWKQKQYGEQDVMIPWHFRDDFKKGQEKKEKEKKMRAGRIRKKEDRREKLREKAQEENKQITEKREKRKQKGKEEDVADVLENSLHLDSPNDNTNNNTNNNNNNTINDNKNNDSENKDSTPTDTTTTPENTSTKTENTKETKSNTSQPASEVYHRYYHLFKEGEIEGLFQQVQNVKLVEVVLDHDNWYVIAEKTN